MILNGAKVWTNYFENFRSLSTDDKTMICGIKSELVRKMDKHSITLSRDPSCYEGQDYEDEKSKEEVKESDGDKILKKLEEILPDKR